ncbi:MAG: hypothetical protein ACYC96_06910 [Fimbriimonadaceae bacterium]
MEAPGAPPPVMIPSDFKSDKIIGVIIMVLGGLFFLAGLFSVAFGFLIAPATHDVRSKLAKDAQHDPSAIMPLIPMDTVFSIMGFVAIAIAILQIASGVGVFKSSKKGLIFALVIAVLSVFGGAFGIIFGVAIGLYTILRLWGNVGPRPA